jgi:AraC-like DNA-binding protein
LGYAVLASSTLRTALGRLARFVPVINDGITFSLDPAGDQLVFALQTDAYPALLLAQEDSLWSWIVGFCRLAAGPHLDPLEVRLLHPEVPCKGEYFGFFRCPMRFNSEHSAILFSQADLDRPLPAANRELAERYITDPDISLQEISSLLGFSELSAFSRAFRRWTGQPPSAARDAAA